MHELGKQRCGMAAIHGGGGELQRRGSEAQVDERAAGSKEEQLNSSEGEEGNPGREVLMALVSSTMQNGVMKARVWCELLLKP